MKRPSLVRYDSDSPNRQILRSLLSETGGIRVSVLLSASNGTGAVENGGHLQALEEKIRRDIHVRDSRADPLEWLPPWRSAAWFPQGESPTAGGAYLSDGKSSFWLELPDISKVSCEVGSTFDCLRLIPLLDGNPPFDVLRIFEDRARFFSGDRMRLREIPFPASPEFQSERERSSGFPEDWETGDSSEGAEGIRAETAREGRNRFFGNLARAVRSRLEGRNRILVAFGERSDLRRLFAKLARRSFPILEDSSLPNEADDSAVRGRAFERLLPGLEAMKQHVLVRIASAVRRGEAWIGGGACLEAAASGSARTAVFSRALLLPNGVEKDRANRIAAEIFARQGKVVVVDEITTPRGVAIVAL